MTSKIFLLFIFTPTLLFAHEAWLMTPEQFHEWSGKPIPSLFTELNWINVSLTLLTLFAISIYYLLGKSRLIYAFPNFQNYFKNNYHLGIFGLRIGMAITLIIAVFGLIPRLGFSHTHIPTLFVSDLQLPANLIWIKWLELVMAVCLIAGICIRLMGALILVCLGIAFYQFGSVVIYYSGYIGGIGIFLLLMGAGRFAVMGQNKFPTFSHKALVMLRILTGLNFMYGGIYYKFLHPNIDIGMLTIHNTFTFGLGPQVFTLLMALVETALGVLLILGKLIRPLCIIILAFLIFMGVLVNENIFAHTFIIGILWVLFLNN